MAIGIGKRSFGLALSGGSLRGAAHIGVLQVMTEHGIYPDYIAGSSIGSLIGALYATGCDFSGSTRNLEVKGYHDILDWNFNICSLFSIGLKILFLPGITKFLPKGLIKGNGIEYILTKVFGENGFDKCRIPLYITATDINTGELVVFTSSKYKHKKMGNNTVIYTDVSLPEAIRASISIPGIFVPKKIKSRTLVDGGVKNNVPVDILFYQGADVIAAVDLGFASQKDDQIDSIIEVLLQTSDIMGQELSDMRTSRYADLVIRPGITDMKLTDFHKIPHCIKKGREAGLQAVPELERLLNI